MRIREVGEDQIQEEKADVNQYEPGGRTVLMEILGSPMWRYDPRMLFAVLDAHPDWNLPSRSEDDFGRYPLHLAVMGLKQSSPDQVSMVSMLVEMALRSMGANPNVTSGLRESPLHNAAEGGALPVVKALLQFGADPLAVDSRFRRPAQIASNPEVARLLTEAEAAARKAN